MACKDYRQLVPGATFKYILRGTIGQAGFADDGYYGAFLNCSEQIITLIQAVYPPIFTFEQYGQSIPYRDIRLDENDCSFVIFTVDSEMHLQL